MQAVAKLFDLSGKRALVTGSSTGIGYALAAGLADAGASIVLNGRNEIRLEEAAIGLRDTARSVDILPFDVTSPEDTARAIDRFENETGPVDILVNNAGMNVHSSLEQFPAEKFDELVRTNFNSMFYVGQAMAKHMIGRQGGRIINIGAADARLVRSHAAPFAATKGAVVNLTRGMAADWARYGITINGIAPGLMRTDPKEPVVSDTGDEDFARQRVPLGRLGEIDELLGAIVFFAGQASSYVNGQTLYVDGGLTVTL